jgi:hypothetical protein
MLGRTSEAREAWSAAHAINPAFTPAFYESLVAEVMLTEERGRKFLEGLRLAGVL